MRNLGNPLLVTALLLIGLAPSDADPAWAAGDAAYPIKVKTFPDAGKSMVVKQTKKQTGSTKVTDEDGKVKEQKTDLTDEEVFTRTVVDRGDKKPKKFKQVYEKAVFTSGERSNDKPHQGCTIVYELKEGKYEAAVEGDTELKNSYLAALAQRFNTPQAEEMFLPAKPVKVGDSWPIDLKEVARSFGSEGGLDEAKSKAEGKLTKVYDKDGKKYGVIELKLYLALNSFGKDKVNPPLIADFRGTLDGVIDGSSTVAKLSLTGTIKGKIKMSEAKTTLELDSTITSEEERSAEK